MRPGTTETKKIPPNVGHNDLTLGLKKRGERSLGGHTSAMRIMFHNIKLSKAQPGRASRAHLSQKCLQTPCN